MKRLTILLVVGLAVSLLAARPGAAATVDFDDVAAPCLFGQTSPLTTEYSGLGVSFSGGGAILHECSNFGVSALSGDNFLAFNTASYAVGPLTMDFSSPLLSFNIFASGGSLAATFNWSAFDAGLNLLGFGSVDSAAGLYAAIPINLFGISRIAISTTDGTYVFDDLQFEAIPEPASLVLVGAGLLALRARSRRRC